MVKIQISSIQVDVNFLLVDNFSCVQTKGKNMSYALTNSRAPETYAPFIPHLRLDSIPNMVKKATLLAVPMIMMIGTSNLPTVSGGPVAYAACMAICLAATWGAFVPACAAACAPSLAAPTP